MNFLSRFSSLQIALGVSVALHAALVGFKFADPEAFNRVFEDTPLEVVLVNARTNETPDKARAIAQASMAGGGEADNGRATSPLPPSLLTEFGELVEDATQRSLQTQQDQQMSLLSLLKQKLANMPLPDPTLPANSAEYKQQLEQRRQQLKQLAEIERRINAENARPKKRVVSPATREAVYAVYYDALRRVIEDRGTQNFPEANGRKLYGELTMLITVNYDGRILSTEVMKSSGNRTLDRRAEQIARAAGPFGSFNDAMRKRADQIMVVSRFRFTRDETLETKLTGQ